MKKKLAVISAIIAVVACMAGCGFDSAKYVQSILDNSYKGETALIMETCKATEEEATSIYESGIEELVMSAVTPSVYNMMDETNRNLYKDAYKRMLSMADYTVGEATTQKDGTYVVELKCHKMKFFVPYNEKAQAEMLKYTDELTQNAAEAGTTPSQEKIYNALYKIDIDTMTEVLDNLEYYPDEEVVLVHVIKSASGNTFEIDPSDIETVQCALMDINEFAAAQ